MEPEDLERFATAANLMGREDESEAFWERAHRTFLERDDREGAARSACRLAAEIPATTPTRPTGEYRERHAALRIAASSRRFGPCAVQSASRMRFDQLADVIREHGASLAVEVTTAFLDRHPDWRVRYGSRATSAEVQGAGYHVAFLAAAVESDDPAAFADYARSTARVFARNRAPLSR